MADETRPSLSVADYDAIAAAVMETARGRWFLAEFARRNRHADTTTLLEAIGRVERVVGRMPFRAAQGPDPALAEISQRLAGARQEIATSVADANGGIAEPDAERAFDDLLAVAQQAAQNSFDAAEGVQEVVWSLRDTGDATAVLGDLDRHALAVYRASSDQSLTVNRVRALVTVLRGIEARIHDLLEHPGEAHPSPPAPSPEAQEVVLLPVAPAKPASPAPARNEDIAFVVPAPAPKSERPAGERRRALASSPLPQAAKPPPRPPSPRAVPFAALDALPTEEKLALFL